MHLQDSRLLKEKEKFEVLFQNASLGILLVNVKGEIILANDFLIHLFGYKDFEDLRNEKIEKLIPSRFHHSHVGNREKYTDHPQKRPMGVGLDLFAVKKNGEEFPVEVSLGSFENEEGRFVVGFVSDISKRKEIEAIILQQKQALAESNLQIEKFNEELEQKIQIRTRQLQETLEQLKKSKDELTHALNKEKELGDLKSRFVSMASHEFRTPLSTILSSASLLAKYTQSDEQEKRDKHIHRIKSAVNNLTDILNEFLSLGKMEDGKIVANYSLFNIEEVIQSLCNEIKGIIKKNQVLHYEHQGDDTVYLDSSMLKNIIINLLSNAIKFSPENGVINVRSVVNLNGISVSISDNGIGIAAADQEHLFERFFRGKNVTNIQGTGLGLHIVSKYVELMDGQIDFVSVLEKGTTFTATFKTTQQK
jgi:PAS domain S-box-containing protein